MLICAVPVLPPTRTSGICAAVPVPPWTTASIIFATASAVSGFTARPSASGFVRWIVFPEAILIMPGMLIICAAFASILGMALADEAGGVDGDGGPEPSLLRSIAMTFDWAAELEREGVALGDAAAVDLAAAVPSAPGWDTTELLRHVGLLYVRSSVILRTGTMERPSRKNGMTEPFDAAQGAAPGPP